jgi:hypothetical protein
LNPKKESKKNRRPIMIKTTNFTMRLTDDDRQKLNEMAQSMGLTNSDYSRRVLLDPKRKPKTKARPSEYILELQKLRHSTGELCGALVQSSIKSREFTGKQNDEIERLIPNIRKLMIRQNELIKAGD